MQPQPSTEQRAKAESFGRQHLTELVTLVFTDIVGSTALKQQSGDKAGAALMQQHHALVREVFRPLTDAEEISTAGDSFLIRFAKPSDPVTFALLLQSRLRTFNQGREVAVQDRIGVHLGEVVITQEQAGLKPRDVYGMHVDTCARVMSLAAGGQILLTRAVFDSARQALKGEDIPGLGQLSWLNHGLYQLKGIEEAVEICEVGEVGAGPLRSPATTEKARRVEAAEGEAVLGWRPAVGQVVPNTQWVLEKKLGEGGFGEVWLGRHQTMKERRVFKFCFRADRVRSLKREMTLFRLIKERIGDHPNIVALREVYFDAPPFYVEEEYVAGQDLRSWSEALGGADKVPLETKLEIVAQVADALQAAHDAGVIHRDVKPGNILIGTPRSEVRSPKWEVKLTDFGIGQVVSAEALAGVTKAGFTQTLLGSTSSQTGTQLYMAPELLAGKPASTRSDIYSLGVVLYQLLVGDFTRPVTTDWAREVSDPLLRDDLTHCFVGNPQERFAGVGHLATNLRTLPHRQQELARQQAELAAREQAAYRRGIVRTATVAALIVAAVTLLAVYALTQSRRVGMEAQRAEAGELAARQNLYAADMNLAYQAWQENNLGRALQLLNRHRPASQEPDLRGWEWRYLWGLCQGEALYTLGQHSNVVYGVYGVAISPDDRYLATADAGPFGGEVRLWDIESRRPMEILETNDAYHSVTFSPDGKALAFATGHHGVRLWDIQEHREITRFPERAAGGYSGPTLGFSPSGRQLAIARADGKVVLWDLATQAASMTLDGHAGGIHALIFSPDGQTLITAPANWHSDYSIRVWSLATGQSLVSLTNNASRLGSVALSPDGKTLASGDWDGRIGILDLVHQRQAAVLTNHTRWVSALAFSPDGKTMASASIDCSIKLWATKNWQEVTTLKGSRDEVHGLVFSSDGRTLFSGSKDGKILAWDGRPRPPRAEVLRRPDDAQRFALSSSGIPWCLNSNHTFNLWDPKTLRKLPEHLVTESERLADYWYGSPVALSPGMERIAMATRSGRIYLLDAAGKRQMPQAGLPFDAEAVEFSPNGKLLAAAAAGKGLWVWDLENLEEVATMRKSGEEPYCGPCFTTNGETVAVGNADGTVEVWNLSRKEPVAEWKAHKYGVSGMAFMPEGKRLVTVGYDNKASVWDLESQRELVPFGRTLNEYRSVAVSPDGQRIAAGTADGLIKIWNSRTGQELVTLKGVNDWVDPNLPDRWNLEYVVGLAFLPPDGNILISGTGLFTGGSGGCEARLWRAPSWAEIKAIEQDPTQER